MPNVGVILSTQVYYEGEDNSLVWHRHLQNKRNKNSTTVYNKMKKFLAKSLQQDNG